jgi:Na+-driven multidrug efflux pump
VLFAVVWNVLIFGLTPVLMHFYALEPQTKSLGIRLVLLHNIFNALAFPFADPLGKGLRATGDVVFTTFVSLFTTIGVRLVLSVIFGIWLNMGVMGIAWAMCLDWSVRGVIFWIRFRQGKWKTFRVI